ncbi:MAG: hypothetical protein Q8Q09_18520 [Deltaproteobacteria bacterium]|nr:hypothetical protein [Deltaproteobacteria bacterium]
MSPRAFDTVAYNAKRYTVPVYDLAEGCLRLEPRDHAAKSLVDSLDPGHPLIQDLNKPFDIARFLTPRAPIRCGALDSHARALFVARSDARNVLDLPIKFPGSDVRLPMEYAQFAPAIQRAVDVEWALNSQCFDEYYAYLTVRRERVPAGGQGHYAPCHVDGFQGARWTPTVRANHTYTVTNALPTMYFVQPFDLTALDLSKHDVFWEMNRQVAATHAEFGVTDYGDFELMLMDAYCVHIAVDAPVETERVWLRLSFEVRVFDRLGNGHNPFFAYDWPMVPRDIEQLALEPFDPSSEASLRIFPWQALDGSRNPPGVYTKPNLRPGWRT